MGGYLFCEHCDFRYLGRLPGDVCGDRSWVPSQWQQVIDYIARARVWRRLTCRGRLWPKGHRRLAKRWTRQEMRAEQRLLGEWLKRQAEAEKRVHEALFDQSLARRAPPRKRPVVPG